MINVLRSEWIKLRTVRMNFVLAIIALAFPVIVVVLTASLADTDGFEKLSFVPVLIITPLTFLGGSFYSIDMLPPAWQTVALFNPVVYLISGFRWSFYGTTDIGVGISLDERFNGIVGIRIECNGDTDNGPDIIAVGTSVVPAPGAVALMGLAAGTLARRRRNK